MSGTRLALSPSWLLAAAILSLHAAAGAALLAALPPWPGAALAVALAALGLHAAWSRALARRTLELDEGGAGAGHRYVSRFLVTLPHGRRTLLVTPDMLSAEEFRRLRVWALWGRLPRRSVAAPQLAS